MLKTTGSSRSAPSVLGAKDEVVGGGSRANKKAKNLSKAKILSKSKKSKNDKSKIPTHTNLGITGEPMFLTPGAREACNQSRQAFTEAPILRHFDPECHIRIETDASGYAIGGVLSQLSSDWVNPDDLISSKSDFGQWHPVAYFSRKMISAETRYKTYNAELLAIVEAFKTWRHYLEGCKHEVLVLIDHNNLCWFMDTKSLSSRQVR